MTERINQDPLEHLFGCLRQTCGWFQSESRSKTIHSSLLVIISDGQRYNFVYRYCFYFADITSRFCKLSVVAISTFNIKNTDQILKYTGVQQARIKDYRIRKQ